MPLRELRGVKYILETVDSQNAEREAWPPLGTDGDFLSPVGLSHGAIGAKGCPPQIQP